MIFLFRLGVHLSIFEQIASPSTASSTPASSISELSTSTLSSVVAADNNEEDVSGTDDLSILHHTSADQTVVDDDAKDIDSTDYDFEDIFVSYPFLYSAH